MIANGRRQIPDVAAGANRQSAAFHADATDLLGPATHCGDVQAHMAKVAAPSNNKPRQAMLKADEG